MDSASKDKELSVLPKPYKKSSQKTPEQCVTIIKDMLAFDWTLKDIQNLRHAPCNLVSCSSFTEQELTSSIFWFYVCTLYFPFDAL